MAVVLGNPQLVGTAHFHAGGQVEINLQLMIRIRREYEFTVLEANRLSSRRIRATRLWFTLIPRRRSSAVTRR